MILAIFGGGSIGQRHAANLRTLGHHVHVYDTDPSRGGDPNRFVPGIVDAILICTPAWTHAEVALRLLARGYRGPLFVEKPLVDDVADAIVFKNWPHPVTMVGYNWRFHNEVTLLTTIARAGMSVHFDCRTDMRTWPGSNYSDPLLECSHEIHLAVDWLGVPLKVHGGWLDGGAGAFVQMEHDHAHSVVDVRWQSEASREITVTLPGPLTGRSAIRGEFPIGPTAPGLQDSYVTELRHFLAAVQYRRPTAIPFEHGLRVVEICEQVQGCLA